MGFVKKTPQKRRSQKLKLVSQQSPKDQEAVVKTLVFLDKIGRKRRIRRDADVKAFIAQFFRKETVTNE